MDKQHRNGATMETTTTKLAAITYQPKRGRSGSIPILFIMAATLIGAQLVIFRIGFSNFAEFNNNNNNNAAALNGGAHGSSRLITDQLLSFKSHRRGTQQQHKQQQQQAPPPDPPNADGTFNGFPIYYRTAAQDFHSSIHCVGENYRETAWMHKSCHFRYLCFDFDQHDYVVFQSPREAALYDELANHRFIDVSTSLSTNNTMSIGGINAKWTFRENGVPRMQWFPRIEQQQPPSYYLLPDDVVMIPFHSLNGNNPGHLLWDDFLPIFTLLHIFQLQEDYHRLLMIRHVLPGPRGLWASCDWLDERREGCEKMFRKFAPLMGISPPAYVSTNHNFTLNLTAATTSSAYATTPPPRASNLVCSKRALAGIGMLTDHGSKLHGWEAKDYITTHNIGRGGMLYQFRNYMMENIGISPTRRSMDDPTATQQQQQPWHILFNTNSSRNLKRAQTFTPQIDAVQRYFANQQQPRLPVVKVTSMVAHQLSIHEQITITSQAHIFITGSGGGAVTAMFLPKGSSLIIYYVEDGGIMGGRRDYRTPARLDWDIFNNMGYVRVHWLPLQTMNTQSDLAALVQLIDHELHIMGDSIETATTTTTTTTVSAS